ncbi:MAG TPA: alpha/beta hydrolase [Desulfobacteraceae bacterium]|nr:alpha/beta hydrolase [Desulfobacteraceae bacterium]|tara:strand:+ start:555 stop:1418 length:864 start_codon:yes stop_codon:yes gene_type:complete
MAREQGFLNGPDNTKLYYQCWLPQGESRAALVVVHGIAEHCGRYMNLVNALVPKGFSVYGIDHYGHGKSGGKRLFVPDFSVFTRGVDLLVDRVREWEPGKQVYVVGHSMGGLITAAWLLDHQKKTDGAILSGPAVKVPDHVSRVTLAVSGLLSTLCPGLGILRLDSNTISRDPAVVTAYVNDPLVSTGKVTARLASQMLGACRRVTDHARDIRLPLLILQGGADALVDPEGSEEFHRAVGATDKNLVVYPGKFHEIFNDPGHDAVFADILEWLNARIASPSSAGTTG